MNFQKGILLLLLVAATISSGCKKKLFDYRNKYCGEWTIELSRETHTFLGPNGSEVSYYETVFENVGISYSKSNDSLIIFDGLLSLGLDEVEVLSNGTFKGCAISGSFKGKKEFFLEKGSCTYSAGGYQISTYHGTKN